MHSICRCLRGSLFRLAKMQRLRLLCGVLGAMFSQTYVSHPAADLPARSVDQVSMMGFRN
jgi:hypothetical protein